MKRASAMAATLIAASIVIASSAFAGDVPSPSPKWELAYHSVVPLGEDSLLLHPGNFALSLLALAESTGFEGWRQIGYDNSSKVLTADGRPVEHYPRFVDFRVTVSARPKRVRRNQRQLLLVDCESRCIRDVNEYLLNLQFRVKIFRALHVTVLEPKAVKLVGTPVRDQHIYHLSFDLGEVPLADRLVLEVLSPAGERLTKFHLDM
jgi:hypothetical protein